MKKVLFLFNTMLLDRMMYFVIVFFFVAVGTLKAQNFSITVDGLKDDFYGALTGPNDGYLQIRSYSFSDNGAPLNDADLSAKVWTAWDSTYFYLYEEVRDNVVRGDGTSNWGSDCIELKFDPQPTDSTQTGSSIFPVNLTALGKGDKGVVTADSLTPVPDSMKQFVRRIVPGGYVLEMAIDWRAIKSSNGEAISVAVDSVFGLGINNHDNDYGSRRASITWAAALLDHIYDTPKYLGTVKFLPDHKLQLIPTNNMTGLHNSVPYDGSDYKNPRIVIDGQRDAFYTNLIGPEDGYLQIKSYDFSTNGIPHGDADLSAKVWTAWDSTWFYLYEEVMDDTLKGTAANAYQNDGLELKFDPQPTDSTQTGSSIFATALTALGMGTTGTGGGATVAADSLIGVADSMKQWARRIIPGGYALELAIKWPAIKSSNGEVVSVAVDSVFGLGINNHDNDATTRQATITWAALLDDRIWNTPKYLGTVKFLADNKLKFIPTNNMTGLTNTLPYDGTPFYMRIDGQIDPFYYTLTGPNNGYLQIRSSAYDQNGAPKNDADLSAKVWTAWDPTWFYLYEEVMDDTLKGTAANAYQNDGLELKFDPVPTDSTQTGSSIFATALTALGMGTTGTGGGATVAADSLIGVADSMKQWARRIIPGGYALELAIKWPAIKSSNGEVVSVKIDSAFGLAINDHDNDATTRQASIIWAAVMDDRVWNTPKYLGTVKFARGNRLNFIPRNNMTGVTNPYKYDGTDVPLSVEKIEGSLPKVFSLDQNYPNPFNPSTTISFSIPAVSQVRLVVYDILGREVKTLLDEKKEAGSYRVTFNAQNFASGIYFCRIEAGAEFKVRKLMLLK